MKTHIWTTEQDTLLWNEYRNHKKKYFADLFGISANAVRCRFDWLQKKGGVIESDRWTEEEEKYLIDNWDKLTARQISKGLGRSRMAVSTKATWLRGKGYELPKKTFTNTGAPPLPVGTIRIKKSGRMFEKQADGKWKYLGMEHPQKRGPAKGSVVKARHVAKPKPPKPKITSAIRVNKPKTAPIEKKIKTFDPTGKVLVRIDAKTWVYRKVS